MIDDRSPAARVLVGLHELVPDLESLYLDLHRHPELSFAEHRTAALLAERLAAAGYRVRTGVGGTGVLGILRNGDGPTVLLRADIDALPVEELTGLDYASTVRATTAEGVEVPVMHACGHDMHATWLDGAAALLAANSARWSGTVAVVFQPGEEEGSGARRMIDDGVLDDIGTPDLVVGQHLAPGPAGWVLTRPGVIMAASDTLRVTLHGRGGHGSRPETTVDPIVLAAAVVLRLQTIVAREIAATDAAVVTVGSLHAGTAANIIPAEAALQVNVRSFDAGVRTKVLAAVERIVHGEAATAGAPEPRIEHIASFPVTDNDASAAEALLDRFTGHFGADRVHEAPLVSGSEDFGEFGTAAGVPSVFWLVGGLDEGRVLTAMEQGTTERDIPSNHSPYFAPILDPTVRTGVETLVVAALSRLTVR